MIQTAHAKRLALMALGLLLAYILLCIVTLRPQETWTGGDFSLYLLHARNIAQGRPYAATGYVQNPENALMSPAAYPPGFPALLAPVWAIAGLNLVAFKLVVIACLAALLAAVFALARPVLGAPLALTLAVIAGAMPALFDRRDQILSDIPATLWCFVALVLFNGARRRPAAWRVLMLGAAVALACATRTAGFALVAALILACIARRPTAWRALLGATLIGAAAAFLAGRVLHVDSGTYLGYLAQLRHEGLRSWVLGSARAYGPGLVGVWGLSFGVIPNLLVLLVLLAFTIFGWWLRVREDGSAPEAFFVAYLALLAIFPVHFEPVRYLVPVSPLLAYYPLVALRHVLRPARQHLAIPLAAAIAIVLIGPYYAVHDPVARRSPSVTSEVSRGLYAAIQRDVGAHAVILARNPRVLALFTEHRSASWPADLTASRFWAYARRIGASWAVDETHPPTRDSQAAHAILATPGAATLAYSNRRFLLWRLKAAPPGHAPISAAP